MKKVLALAIVVSAAFCGFGAYRTVGTSAEPNEWTSNYDGVIAAAKQTGYPIMLIMVNSATCGHCHTMNNYTLSSQEFKTLESELAFYRVMIDQALVSDSQYAYVWRKYSRYFDDSTFPLIAVLRNDGSVYGAYSNHKTDRGNVTADVRKWVEAVSTEQVGKVVWIGDEPTTPVTPVTPAKPAATVAAWAEKLKAKSNGVAFDANEDLVASVVFKVTKKGKVSAKFTSSAGITNIKGDMTLSSDGVPQVKAGGLVLEYDSANGVWAGTRGDWTVLIVQGKQSATGYDGLYTLSAENAAGTLAGYMTLTVKNGKGKAKGQVNGKNKISANNPAVVIPAAAIDATLEDWSALDTLFAPVSKRGKASGGVAVAKSGEVFGTMTAGGGDWILQGAKWNTATSEAALDGKNLMLIKGETLTIPLTMKSATKVGVGANSYGAKISVQPKKGTFKGSAKLNGARCQFIGTLLKDGDAIRGFGTSYGAAGTFPVWIE